jgi:hypothetical protein
MENDYEIVEIKLDNPKAIYGCYTLKLQESHDSMRRELRPRDAFEAIDNFDKLISAPMWSSSYRTMEVKRLRKKI